MCGVLHGESGRGCSIAKVLVEERLAACVNIASVESFFFWNGEFCKENEAL